MPSYRPSLSAALPDGWLAKESITLLAPDGQANVIISSEPIDAIDSRQYAESQGWLLAHEFPHFQQHQFEEVVVFGGFLGYVRQFSWTPPDGVEVTQVQLYLAMNGRGYTATATTPSTRFAEREAILRTALFSAVVDQ